MHTHTVCIKIEISGGEKDDNFVIPLRLHQSAFFIFN